MTEPLLHKLWYDPETGYTSANVLYNRAKLLDKKIMRYQVDEWLAKQRTAQLHKQTNQPPIMGHITAFAPNDRWQADLIDMSAHPSLLNGQKQNWILVVVDVFTRKIYAHPQPTKHAHETAKAFDDILQSVASETNRPGILNTDNGGEFGKTFDNGINQDLAPHEHKRNNVGDHRALGVVDSAIKMLKGIIYRFITAENDDPSSWASNLQKLVNNMNNIPRTSLNGRTPNQVATDKKSQEDIFDINSDKSLLTSLKATEEPPYKVGDKVRVPIQRTFKRGFKHQQTDKVYPVIKVTSNSVIVNVDGTQKRFLFSEVNQTGVPLDKDVFEVEKVLQTRVKKVNGKNIQQYLVKWKGYDDSENSWVNQEDMMGDA
eukprot:Pompholyxophrys_punicea_v1_NODE_8_length_8388_cov_12.748020.p2 type:complete len:373 gc:universal NODE_8_length_8388_cov_12.748020:1305-2423(+)